MSNVGRQRGNKKGEVVEPVGGETDKPHCLAEVQNLLSKAELFQGCLPCKVDTKNLILLEDICKYKNKKI